MTGNPRTVVACVYRTGGDFDAGPAEYVRRLRDSVPRDLHMVCLTNAPDRLISVERVELVPLREHMPGWRSKYELFRPGLFDDFDRVLYLDLDTVVNDARSALFTGAKDTSDFMMLRDFLHPDRLNSGVMAWRTHLDLSHILVAGLGEPGPDGPVVAALAPDPGVLQDVYSITSYKAHREQGHITCFHGQPRPHHVGWSATRAAPKPDATPARYTAPPSKFDGEDVYIIGGGPSLAYFDMASLAGRHCLAVNDAYWYPQCHTLFFGDKPWYRRHKEFIELWAERDGNDVVTTADVNEEYITRLRPCGGLPPPARRKMLYWNANSGVAACHLAMIMGAARIYLVGFDLDDVVDGQSNWHPNFQNVGTREMRKMREHWAQFFDLYQVLWASICDVILATPNSRVPKFPYVEIDGWHLPR